MGTNTPNPSAPPRPLYESDYSSLMFKRIEHLDDLACALSTIVACAATVLDEDHCEKSAGLRTMVRALDNWVQDALDEWSAATSKVEMLAPRLIPPFKPEGEAEKARPEA